MLRENYYVILELSIDPPENDLDIIEKTIQSKKAEWSRMRNHPTKGLQAQKYINMIPNIQEVMLSDELTQKCDLWSTLSYEASVFIAFL